MLPTPLVMYRFGQVRRDELRAEFHRLHLATACAGDGGPLWALIARLVPGLQDRLAVPRREHRAAPIRSRRLDGHSAVC
jgi:hypothetical protein